MNVFTGTVHLRRAISTATTTITAISTFNGHHTSHLLQQDYSRNAYAHCTGYAQDREHDDEGRAGQSGGLAGWRTSHLAWYEGLYKSTHSATAMTKKSTRAAQSTA